MADNAPVLIWETDEDGVLSVNAHYLRFFGVTFREVSGMGWARFLHPDDAVGYLAACAKAFEQRSAYEQECRFRRADGEYRWLRSTGGPFGEDRFVGGSVDVTEIVEGRRALRKSEENQRTLLEGMPQLVWRSQDNGQWTWSSPQWQRFTGQTQAESLGHGWLDAVHPDDRDVTLEAWKRTTETGVLDVEHRLRNAATGGYRWHHTRSVPVRGRAGEVLEWLGTSTDVEDLRRSEAARVAAEERFKLFARNVQEYAFVQTDAEGAITDWNPGAERLFGFSAERMVGQNFGSLFTPEDDEARIFPKELAYVAEGRTNEDARWFVRGDGTRFWARWTTEPIYDERHGFLGVAKVMRDETERERAYALIRKGLLDKDELLKEIHHRVKNNLQVVISLLNLQAKQVEDARLLAMLEESRNRVQSIAAIHELLYHSESLASIGLATYAERLVPNLVRFYGLEDRVRPEIGGGGAALELERAAPFGMLLNEIVSNACKHAYSGRASGTLKVTFTREGREVELTVADDGPGLPAGFDYRNAGTLGLKLVNGLTRQLGGTLSIESSTGTTVRARFPVLDDAEVQGVGRR